MPIRCPRCGTKHDVVEFEAGQSIDCRCGFKLDLALDTVDDFLRYSESETEREKAREIQQNAQDICRMILDEQCPEVDIEIAKEKLEEKVAKFFPDKMEVYRMIYEARFKRLWDQFRSGQMPD